MNWQEMALPKLDYRLLCPLPPLPIQASSHSVEEYLIWAPLFQQKSHHFSGCIVWGAQTLCNLVLNLEKQQIPEAYAPQSVKERN